MEERLTCTEAYAAMFNFLDALSAEFGNDAEIGGILGSMSLLDDGEPVDKSFWHIWLESVEKAKKGDSNSMLKLKK
jgi:hypothetical protein